MAQYTKEQYWKIYETLPQQLKEAVFSAETADHIFETCETNKVEEVSKVAAEVGDVLMGLTLPKDFETALKKNVGLKPAVAQSIAQGINRLVFYPNKAPLEEIHRDPIKKRETPDDIGVPTPRHTEIQQENINAEDDYAEIEEYSENPLPNEEQENQESEKAAKKTKPQSSDPYREASE
jgi:hypothetical protein